MTSKPIFDHDLAKKTLIDMEIEKCTLISRGYTKDYVKELEQELHRVMKENAELKSKQESSTVLAKDQIKDAQKQNQSLTQKINFLILLIREISNNSVNREDILLTLKAILDGDFSKFSPSISSHETYIGNGKIHEFSQYLSIKDNIHKSKYTNTA